MNYDFECLKCGWTGHRYANLKRCPKCGHHVQRMITVQEEQAAEIERLRKCVDAADRLIEVFDTYNKNTRGDWPGNDYYGDLFRDAVEGYKNVKKG